MSLLHKYACWTGESALEILSVEALERREHTFLAVHTPIRGFEISGTHGTDIDEPSEGAVLDALSSPSRRHVFCVVEGEPGSGKSHLIRWLKAKWPSSERDMPILIQRADGSLEGTLRQLRQRLPQRFEYLLQGLGGAVHDATDEGRARLFRSGLAASTRADHFADPLPDAEWCEKWQLEKILNNEVVQDEWSGPARILRILAGRGLTGDARNSLLAEFDLFDIMDIGRLFGKGTSGRQFQQMPKLLWHKLFKEADVILPYKEHGEAPETVLGELAERVPESCKFLQAINSRLNHAVQNVLGISANGLKEIFFSLRRELRKENARLVLFLEDITNFQGVDHELIDVIVTQSSTREPDDLCDMVSIVGITPQYYAQHLAKANYIARITHMLRMGSKDTDDLQDAAITRDKDVRTAFAARYMRAMRLTPAQIVQWYEGSQQELPNVCLSCSLRTECHASFGAVEIDGSAVGLYPFTSDAISNMFERLNDPDSHMALQTPRGMIQGVLFPVLKYPEAITAGVFPSATLETRLLPESAFYLDGPTLAMLDANVSSDEEKSRLRRLIALWARPYEARNTQNGNTEFAGVAKPIFEHFGLPFVSDDQPVSVSGSSSVESIAPSLAGSEATAVHVEETAQAGAAQYTPQVPVVAASSPALAPQRLSTVTRATQATTEVAGSRLPKQTLESLERRRNQLNSWRNSSQLPEENYWNRCLHIILQTDIPWSLVGVPPYIRGKLFTESNVKIEGTFKTKDRKSYFVVAVTKWLIDGLEAHEVLRGPHSPERAAREEFYRQNYARMVERLTSLVQSHTSQLLAGREAAQWSFEADAAAFLTVRNWLRGVVLPSDPPWRQLEALLEPEGEVISSPRKRVETWDILLNASSGVHDKARTILREWISLTQGESGEAALCDPGRPVEAISRLRESLQLPTTLPAEVRLVGSLAEVEATAAVCRTLHSKLESLPRLEYRRLKDMVKEIDTRLRGNSVAEHCRRVETVLAGLGRGTEAPHQALAEGQSALRKLKSYAEDGTALIAEGFMESSAANEAEEPSDSVAQLEWCIKTPAGPLSDIREQLRILEGSLESGYEWLNSYLQKFGGGSDSEDLCRIQAAGTKLIQTVDSLHESLRGVK